METGGPQKAVGLSGGGATVRCYHSNSRVCFRSERGAPVCSFGEGGLSLRVQPGVCERRRGLGSE